MSDTYNARRDALCLWQFEIGEYSDRRQGEPVLGPKDADIDALAFEWAEAVSRTAGDFDPHTWRHDEGAMLLALGDANGLPIPSWGDESAFFTLWLVARKGWHLQEARRVALDETMDAVSEEYERRGPSMKILDELERLEREAMRLVHAFDTDRGAQRDMLRALSTRNNAAANALPALLAVARAADAATRYYPTFLDKQLQAALSQLREVQP